MILRTRVRDERARSTSNTKVIATSTLAFGASRADGIRILSSAQECLHIIPGSDMPAIGTTNLTFSLNELLTKVNRMQVVFEMRYSYFGKSGWRSRASKDPNRLFDSERLKKRADLFEKIALASLSSQDDTDFKLVLLSSEGLPDGHKTYLKEMCNDVLGSQRAHVLFRRPEQAGTWFKKYLRNSLNDQEYTAQIVLDDDDAVSNDFVSVMRREALALQSLFENDEDYCYFSQAQGLSAVFESDRCQLLHRTSPLNTQGLMLVARTDTRRNPFFTAHKRLARNHPVRVIYGSTPYYIRAVHDTNDSRALHGEDVVSPEEIATYTARFPLLRNLIPEYEMAA